MKKNHILEMKAHSETHYVLYPSFLKINKGSEKFYMCPLYTLDDGAPSFVKPQRKINESREIIDLSPAHSGPIFCLYKLIDFEECLF